MAELVVRAEYKSDVRNGLLMLTRTTFPIWGIICPLAGTSSLVAGFVIMIYHHCIDYAWLGLGDNFYMLLFAVFSFSAVSLAAFGLGLVASKLLGDDHIVADQNGVRFPLAACKGLSKYRSWSEIRKIEAIPAVENDWKRRSLVFYGDKGVARLALGRMTPTEIEQVVLAIEMWAGDCEKDSSLKAIQEQLQNEAPARHDLSYTEMWESELQRRFCPASFMPLEPGCCLRKGTLKIIRQLAMGGLSAVYLCQLEGKELVVIKEAVVPDDRPENIREKAKEMFEREATLLMKLNHPNIVKVRDHFVDQGRHYMMLEYINGQDMRQFIQQHGQQSERLIVDWAIQIANMLKHLHEQDPPVIHRDLTPDNLVLREDGTLVLIDFGAANEFIGTATGTFVGKQSYIAPEQFRGKAVIQSDIYAFGCTLFYMLTAQDPEALSESSPKRVREDTSSELDDLVISCTQLTPRDRYQSAAQMLPVLKRLAASMVLS